MITMGGVLTVAGIGLTVGVLETILESMNKAHYATIIKLVCLGIFAFAAIELIGELMTEIEVFLTQWNY